MHSEQKVLDKMFFQIWANLPPSGVKADTSEPMRTLYLLFIFILLANILLIVTKLGKRKFIYFFGPVIVY